MGHQPGPHDVEVDHGLEAFWADRLGRAQELASRVVDKDVEAAVSLQEAIDEPADRLLFADVERLLRC